MEAGRQPTGSLSVQEVLCVVLCTDMTSSALTGASYSELFKFLMDTHKMTRSLTSPQKTNKQEETRR